MFWQTTRHRISLQSPVIMGIVNVTPDSFSGVGNSAQTQEALAHAQQLLKEGAAILDLGAESTRPGATPLPLEEEWMRLKPVLEEVLKWNTPVSVDTYKAQIMRRALDLGADIINDVWALRHDNALEVLAAHPSCGVCVMHMHLEPQTMQSNPMTETENELIDVVSVFLLERARKLEALGVDSERVCLDPGIGFGKTPEQNFTLLRKQERFADLGYPLMAGWSRKSSLGVATGLPVHERTIPSVVAAVLAVQNGAHIVRVHDVKETISALQVLAAMHNTNHKLKTI
jgi:dihydropteroate synthase